MAYFTPIYLNYDEVKIRLQNKIEFTTTDPFQGLTTELANDIIANAEAEVEEDLRVWYAIPFVTETDEDWSKLPRNTQLVLKNLLLYKAQIRLLQSAFLKQDPTRNEHYIEEWQAEYDRYFAKHFTLLDGVFLRQPLAGLKLVGNNVANQRLKGIQVAMRYTPSITYAINQVTDPSVSRIYGFAWGRRRYN
jgi:hypothetical protein